MTGITKDSPFEHPNGSGIRISVVANREKGKIYSRSFRVHVPNRITGKGRIQKQFPTLGKAKAFSEGQYLLSKRHGQATFNMTDEQRVDAVRALETLNGTNLTLDEVAQYARPRLRPQSGTLTVQQVVNKMLQARDDMNLRARTIQSLKSRLTKFCETFGDANILEIEETDITKWIKNPKLSSRSRLNYYRSINQFFIWAKEEKHISDNPLSTVSKNKLQEIIGRQDERPPAIYTPREAQLLLEAAIGEEIFPLLVIGFFCGLRTAELQRLEWEHFRFDDNDPFVTVFPSNAKSRSLRNVRLNKSAIEWLSLCNKGHGPVFKKKTTAWTRYDKRIHEKAGVAKKENGLRHSFGSYHYAMYGDEIKTATQMGHNPNDHSLFSNYRALVSKAAAVAFWAIKVPSKNKKLVQFPS
tara:strand:+ start:8830 stop:10065 length:1236 start_codon:yes stop_codon:yes gene_type:complete